MQFLEMTTKFLLTGKFLVPLTILIFILSGANVCGADVISVNKTANVTTAEVGDVISYKIVIKNEGNETLHNTTVEDTLPYGVRYVKGSKSIVCSGDAVGAPIGAKIGARIGAKVGGGGGGGAYIGVKIGVKIGAKIGANINGSNRTGIGARIGAKGYPETRYEVYLKPALLNRNLTEIYQEPALLDERIIEIYQDSALWDERIIEIYQDSALWDERIIEIYQTPVLWNESKVTLFDIYGNLMYPEYLPLYSINNMSYQEICTITYQINVSLCHQNATNYANVTVKNSNNETVANEIDSAIVDIPCQLPDFTITNMSIPVMKEIKNVTIPYGTNERNETLIFSAQVFLNKTQIGDEKKIYFDVENSGHLPYTNFDAVNITLYDNSNYYNSIIRNFTNIVKITNISFNWTPAIPGWHNLTITIDPENVIQESNELNNNRTLEILVVLPDLAVTNISMPVIKEVMEVIIPYGTDERNETLISSELVIANKTQIGKERIIYFDIKNLEEPPFPTLSNVTIAMYDNGNYYNVILHKPGILFQVSLNSY